MTTEAINNRHYKRHYKSQLKAGDDFQIAGTIIKDDKRYYVVDNTELTNLVVSTTRLNAKQSTTGHRHAGQEEVYIFTKGAGQMELDFNIFNVKEGSTVLIHDNVFHKVHNTGDTALEFTCVFDGRRNH
tara:strand:+ start:289 stop:675 length:387 start_codon:yes stop_codon:yes gene_type:complete